MNELEERMKSKETDLSKSEPTPPNAEEAPPTLPHPESRARSFLRGFARWTSTVLIAFGLGALTIYFLYLAPARKDLDQNSTELEEINQQVDALTDQLDEVTKEKQELESELNTAQVRLVILDTISDVRAANLSVANDDYPGALLSLKDAAQALERLSETVSEEQSEVVSALQDSLTEIEKKVKSDPESAKSDLDRLTTNLIKLENSILE
jgi:DNA repair ATPase RecN